jgi:hypothetical protein
MLIMQSRMVSRTPPHQLTVHGLSIGGRGAGFRKLRRVLTAPDIAREFGVAGQEQKAPWIGAPQHALADALGPLRLRLHSIHQMPAELSFFGCSDSGAVNQLPL